MSQHVFDKGENASNKKKKSKKQHRSRSKSRSRSRSRSRTRSRSSDYHKKRSSEKKRKKKKRRKSKSKSKSQSPKADQINEHPQAQDEPPFDHDPDEIPFLEANTKKDNSEEARLIIQLKSKRCTTSKNVFADLQPLTEESFVSEDDQNTNKITISSIEDIPTIGGHNNAADQAKPPKPKREPSSPTKKSASGSSSQSGHPTPKPLSFEFIGPSRAIQKKLNKKGIAVMAAQEFPSKIDLEKLKEYRKKSGPAPKLFLPTEQDKHESNADQTQDMVIEEETLENNIIENGGDDAGNKDDPDQGSDHEHRRSRSRTRSYSRSRSRSYSYSSSSRSRSRSRSRRRSRTRTRTPDIPIRRGSPSFLEKRRITSARKRPIPYRRKRFHYESPSSESSYSSYSRSSSRSYSRSSRSRSRSSSYERNLRVPWSRSRSRSLTP